MPDGMSGIDLGEIGQAAKQQGQKVTGQVTGSITKQITGSGNSTPTGQTPKTTTGIDLVDFGKGAANQFGVKSGANPKPPVSSAGLGNQLFGKPKPGTGGLSKGFGDIFGGEVNKKNLFGGSGGVKKPLPETQMPDFSHEEAEKEEKLKAARKRLFDEVYGNQVLDIGKTDQNKKKREEEQKKQEEEEEKRREEQEKAQEEDEGLSDFGSNSKQKRGMIGQPRNKKGGFNFLKWLKPKRQSNEANSGNRG